MQPLMDICLLECFFLYVFVIVTLYSIFLGPVSTIKLLGPGQWSALYLSSSFFMPRISILKNHKSADIVCQPHSIALGGVFPNITDDILNDENAQKVKTYPKSGHLIPKFMNFH